MEFGDKDFCLAVIDAIETLNEFYNSEEYKAREGSDAWDKVYELCFVKCEEVKQ